MQGAFSLANIAPGLTTEMVRAAFDATVRRRLRQRQASSAGTLKEAFRRARQKLWVTCSGGAKYSGKVC